MIHIPNDLDLPYEWRWFDEAGNRRMPTAEENPSWYNQTDGILRGSLKPIEGKCGSKLRKTDPPRYCMASRVKGGMVCRIHGGKTPGGIASPNFVNGRYSKYMPKNMKGIAKDVANDPELLSLRDDLVVQTSWIAHKLNEFNKTPPPDYGTILLLFGQLKKAKKPEETAQLMEALDALLNRGLSVAKYHASLEESIRTLIQERTKTATAEWKRLHDLNALVPFEQVIVLLDSLLMVIRDVVGDERKLALIQDGMRRLMPTEGTVITLSQREGVDNED